MTALVSGGDSIKPGALFIGEAERPHLAFLRCDAIGNVRQYIIHIIIRHVLNLPDDFRRVAAVNQVLEHTLPRGRINPLFTEFVQRSDVINNLPCQSLFVLLDAHALWMSANIGDDKSPRISNLSFKAISADNNRRIRRLTAA